MANSLRVGYVSQSLFWHLGNAATHRTAEQRERNCPNLSSRTRAECLLFTSGINMVTLLYKQSFYLNEAHDNLLFQNRNGNARFPPAKLLMSALLRLYSFQPSLEQHETSGIFSAAKPFATYSPPGTTNIHLTPTLPTEHFCRQQQDQVEVKHWSLTVRKMIGCSFCNRKNFLSILSNWTKKRKKNPCF